MQANFRDGTLGVDGQPYVCWVPGGGDGTIEGHPALEWFARAAELVVRACGLPCILLRGPLYGSKPLECDGVTVLDATHEQCVDLIQTARIVVTPASSTLFQALAQRKVCVATGCGGEEQLPRALDWGRSGIVESAPPQPEALASATLRLLADESRWRSIHERVVRLEARNGLDDAVNATQLLLASASDPQN